MMFDQAQGLRDLAQQSRQATDDAPEASPKNHEITLREEQVSPAASKSRFFPPRVAHSIVDTRQLDASQLGYAVVSTQSPVSTPTGLSETPKIDRPKVARVIAVTSGKGGVGKTNFSTNLSLVLAKQGKRVIVVDADLGLANLHVVFGFTPERSLEHVLRGDCALKDILCMAPGGVQVIAGGSGIVDLANLTERQRDGFIAGLQELDTLADVIIIDTGAGLSRGVLAFLNAAEEIIVVTTPEPTSLTDAYATIKVVAHENPTAKQRLVVNMAQSEAEADAVAHKLTLIAQRFLGIAPEYLGFVPLDASVPRAVRAQQPFVIGQPHSEAAKAIEVIVERLGYKENEAHPTGFTGFMNRMQRFFGFAEPGTK